MIKFKQENLQLETGQGVYDQEVSGVTTIINFSYQIFHYEFSNNRCDLCITIEDSRQWINDGTFDRPIKLMPSEVMILKELISDKFNKAPTDFGLVEYLENEILF